jgi:hypothetical protein
MEYRARWLIWFLHRLLGDEARYTRGRDSRGALAVEVEAENRGR